MKVQRNEAIFWSATNSTEINLNYFGGHYVQDEFDFSQSRSINIANDYVYFASVAGNCNDFHLAHSLHRIT